MAKKNIFSSKEWKKVMGEPVGSKYGNKKKLSADGERFDSQAEHKRWGQLKLRERLGEITDLRRQVPYSFDYNGVHIATYKADFVYQVVATGETVVEDEKGHKTGEYRIKKQLMLAMYGIAIVETKTK